MYERVQLSEHDSYMDCPSKIGILRVNGEEAVFFDSGNDGDAGKKGLKLLTEAGLRLRAVYNTHSHADHIGGNRLLTERTGCKIYGSEIEAAMTRYPFLEGAMIYGGYPVKDLRSKFFLAKESPAETVTEKKLPHGVTLYSVPGHSPAHTAYLTEEGTLFSGDAVAPGEMLKKHSLLYLWNVEQTLRSLEILREIPALRAVPSHGPVIADLRAACDFNRDMIFENAERMKKGILGTVTFENLLRFLFREYGISSNAEQYSLISSILRSYLTWLFEKDEILIGFEDGTMVLERK